MTRWFVDPITGNDANSGTDWAHAFKTIQKGITVSATDDEIVLAAASFPAEDFDLSAAPVDTRRIIINSNYYSICKIRRFKKGSASLLIQNGEWFWGDPIYPNALPFNPEKRTVLFDNATVHIERYSFSPQVFYHCDVIVNALSGSHVFLCCKAKYNDSSYWYHQQFFYHYFCDISAPEGIDDVMVPLYDLIENSDFLSSIVRRDYLKPRNSRSSFLQRTLSLENVHVPWNSINGPSINEGPDVAAKDDSGNYINNDWVYLLGPTLEPFRDKLSLGNRNGNDRANAVVWTPSTEKRFGEYVFPTTSTGKYYRCQVAGFTGSVEPPWPIVDGAIVIDGSVTWVCVDPSEVPKNISATIFQAPNFFEQYIKNLFNEVYIMNERLLYLQGILNSQYLAEGIANLYEKYGMDIKSIVAYNLHEMWNVAGSILGMMNMLNSDNCSCGIWEFNKKRNFPIGRLPFYYDVVTEEFVFHRRVHNWWSSSTRLYWSPSTPISIGDIIYVPGPSGEMYEFECTGEGTTSATEPSWSFNYLEYVSDNDVTWRCFGLAATPLVGGQRKLRAAYDYIRHYFDYDYTMEVVRQKNVQTISSVEGWQYLYFNPSSESYGIITASPNTTIVPLFEQYLINIRNGEREPIAFVRVELDSGVKKIKEVILLQGGVIGYDAAFGPVPDLFVDWPNNVFSYATISRGGLLISEKNTEREDAIIENIFRRSFALDTVLYRQAFVKSWDEYKERSATIDSLVIPTNPTLVAERYVYRCVVAGVCGASEPTWNTTPGGITVDGTTQWKNIGYFKTDWKQIENP